MRRVETVATESRSGEEFHLQPENGGIIRDRMALHSGLLSRELAAAAEN